MWVKSTPARWLWKPLPAFDQTIFPGLFLAKAMSSFTVLTGIFGFTTRMFCVTANKDTVAKSLNGS
jgi:hypothetical protein